MSDHRQTAKWLLVLANTLGPRERRFLNDIATVRNPSALQQQWLERIASRVEANAAKGMRHAA